MGKVSVCCVLGLKDCPVHQDCSICVKNGLNKSRVEGVIGELKDTLTTLKAIDSELDRRNVDMMLKTLIKVKEKRLKNLESGKE